MIDYARGRRPRGNVRYEVRDLRSVTPSMDGLFDAIVCAHTLHYVGTCLGAVAPALGGSHPEYCDQDRDGDLIVLRRRSPDGDGARQLTA